MDTLHEYHEKKMNEIKKEYWKQRKITLIIEITLAILIFIFTAFVFGESKKETKDVNIWITGIWLILVIAECILISMIRTKRKKLYKKQKKLNELLIESEYKERL